MSRPLDQEYTWSELCVRTTKLLITKGRLRTKAEANKFNDWFMEREKIGWLFDPLLIYRCFKISGWLREDRDHVICTVGDEGSGKSTLSLQVGAWIDPSMVSTDICLETESVMEHFDEEKRKYSSLILDEGGLQFFSREAMSAGNKGLAKLFMICRVLNRCILINIPDIKFLDTSIKGHRIKTLLIVTERGKYKGVNSQGIKTLLKNMKKGYGLKNAQIGYDHFWQGHFRKGFPKTISREDYDVRKMSGVREYISKMRDKAQRDSGKLIGVVKASKMVGVSAQTIRNMIIDGRIQGKKISTKWFLPPEALEGLLKMPDVATKDTKT